MMLRPVHADKILPGQVLKDLGGIAGRFGYAGPDERPEMQEKRLFLKRFCAADGCGEDSKSQAEQRFQPIKSSLLSSLPSSLQKRPKRQKESGDGAVSLNRKSGPKNVKARMNTGFMRAGHWLETIGLIQCDHGHTFSAIVTNVLLGHIGLALVTPAWFGHKAAFLKSP